jgi:hypothetical protein
MVPINSETNLSFMDEEEEFFKRYEEYKNKKKLLLEFDGLNKNYDSPKFKLDKPKYKKKLKASIFNPNKHNNKNTLF